MRSVKLGSANNTLDGIPEGNQYQSNHLRELMATTDTNWYPRHGKLGRQF